MKTRLLCGLSLAFAILLVGCATPTKMAFESDDEKLVESGKAVFLLTVTLKNSYREWFQPKLRVLHIEKPGAKDAADKLNFIMDDKGRMETGTLEAGNTYFLRLPLEKGPFEIRGLTSIGGSFLLFGTFVTPLPYSIVSSGSGVHYLGHVSATVRERQGDEFRAGPMFPLADQAMVGATGGTFDVDISDRLAADEATFRSRFPALQAVEIKKAVLPPFDRARAQKWWQDL